MIRTSHRSLLQLAIFAILLLIASNGIVADEHDGDGNDHQGNDDSSSSSSSSYTSATGYVRLNNCRGSTVQMTAMNILCNSPSTYYYQNGNNANNNNNGQNYQRSGRCNYGDNFQINAGFQLNHNLDYDDEIYMTMGIYAANNESTLLFSARAVNLCSTLVKEQCTTYGQYNFYINGTLDTLYDYRSNFLPLVQMGFSNRRDEGYSLGGTNIDCDYDEGYLRYTPWLKSNNANVVRKGGGNFFAKYGILLGVLIAVVAYALVVSRRYGVNLFGDCNRTPEPWNEDLLIVHTSSRVGTVP